MSSRAKWGLLAITGLLLMASLPPTQVTSVEYFVRWQRSEFRHHHGSQISWLKWFIPPAYAELPPQYQRAFSLYLQLNHSQKNIQAEWYARMVMEPESFRYSHKTYALKDYQRLLKNLNGKIRCESHVGIGWSGPSPEYIRIKTEQSQQLFYASLNEKNGPDGPQGKEGERQYLCSQALADQLQTFRQDLHALATP